MSTNTKEELNQRQALQSIVNDFFSSEENFDKLDALLNKKKISLRVLEFAAVNEGKFLKKFDSYGAFQTALDSAGKKSFDSFRRHEKFEYSFKGKKVVTNLAQLRFLKYTIENGVLAWLENEKNCEIVEKALKKATILKMQSKKENKKKKKKRKLLSQPVGVANKSVF